MYKSKKQFKAFNIGNQWGQYTDIEENYEDIISRPFPFSTSKPVTKLIPMPMPKQFKNYDIESNIPEEKKEYNKFIENTKVPDLKHNISMTMCISVSIITYILFFIMETV